MTDYVGEEYRDIPATKNFPGYEFVYYQVYFKPHRCDKKSEGF